MMEKLSFPITFDKCPHCGSTVRVAEYIIRQEIEQGKLPKETVGGTTVTQAVLADPRTIALTARVLVVTRDICADCGWEYCIRVDLAQGRPQVPIQKSPFKGIPPFGRG